MPYSQPIKRISTYSGTTDANGDFTVVYPTAWPVVPCVIPVLNSASDGTIRVRNSVSTTTGFTIRSEKNAVINLLSTDLLAIGINAVANVPVKVFVIEN